MKKVTVFFLITAIISLFPTKVCSQDKMPVQRIKGEFRFDGIIDDNCWDNIKPLEIVMHTPVFGSAPSEKTEVMMCYDNSYLYIGARMFDSDPSGLLVASRKRDEALVSSEEIMLVFDSFNDKENAIGFSTTPSGIRNDFTISRDGMMMGGDPKMTPLNMSWNTFWDVKTTRDKSGWFAEFRIPFSSMRFKDSEGKVVMGFICIHKLAHKKEVDVFPSIPPNWGEFSPYRPSLAQEIEFDGLKSRKPFYIAPYVIGGYTLENNLNTAGTAYELEKAPDFTGGLDLKYGLTNNLTMDLTLNTDFAQVEADDEQINLTRFDLFYPEKRTFFQERSSVFMFDFDMGSSLFYSRRIGLSEEDQVPIYGGARITGMAGKWDLGFLDMQTRAISVANGADTNLPSENFGILRLRRQVINPSSYVGGIFTSRLGADGTYNITYGLDGTFKIGANDYLNIKAAEVLDNDFRNKALSLDPAKLFLSWRRYSQKGLSYSLGYSRAGKDFDPGIGFQMRTDYTQYSGSLGYGWLPGKESPIQNHKLNFINMLYVNNSDNSTQSNDAMLRYEIRMKSGYRGSFTLHRQLENVTDTFSFSDEAYVIPGIYTFNRAEAHLNSPQTNRLVVGMDLMGGSYYDGSGYSIAVEPALNIGASLQLGLRYNHNIIDFDDRGQHFRGDITGIRATVMFSTKLSASTFIQYNTADKNVLSNIRIRYNPGEGNDLYIVWNEGRNTWRDMENPRLPIYSVRSFLIKYTYTFTL